MVRCRARVLLSGAWVLVCVLAGGCGSSGTGPSSGAVSSGPSPSSPGGSTAQEDSAAQEELYAEAERVYRAYFELEQQAFLEGGVNGVPVQMNDYIMGKYANLFSDILTQMVNNNWRMRQGTREQIGLINPAPEIAREDSVVTLRVCIDSSNSPLVDDMGNIVGSGFSLDTVFFKYDTDGKLKIYGTSGESVKSCASS